MLTSMQRHDGFGFGLFGRGRKVGRGEETLFEVLEQFERRWKFGDESVEV